MVEMHPMVRSIDKGKKRGLGPLRGEDSDAKMLRPRFSRASSSDCVSTDMQEESSPWRSLPSDILERALALLPLPYIFRLRCVCKRWNALIQCSQFQEWSLRCPVAWGPFFLPCVRWKGIGSRAVPWSSYNLVEQKWIRMPQLEFPSLNGYSGWCLMAANGGLLCFRDLDGGRILVCNPLTNRWKELPFGRLDLRVTIISCMIVEEHRNSYKILFAGNATHSWRDSRYGTVDLYDSTTNTWSIGQNISVGNNLYCGAYCSGELYCLARQSCGGPYSVLILDLTMMRWREKTIPIPIGFSSPFIVACLGRIYLVGGRNDTDSYPVVSIVVFLLDQSNKWTKVSEYSEEHFLGYSGDFQRCRSNGSKIYVVVTDLSVMWVAVYDCAMSCWEEPIQKEFMLDMLGMFQTKFTFQPNLRVTP